MQSCLYLLYVAETIMVAICCGRCYTTAGCQSWTLARTVLNFTCDLFDTSFDFNARTEAEEGGFDELSTGGSTFRCAQTCIRTGRHMCKGSFFWFPSTQGHRNGRAGGRQKKVIPQGNAAPERQTTKNGQKSPVQCVLLCSNLYTYRPLYGVTRLISNAACSMLEQTKLSYFSDLFLTGMRNICSRSAARHVICFSLEAV